MTARGGWVEREHSIVGTWPVQFLPPGDALDEEALAQAVETDVDGIKTRVMRVEGRIRALASSPGRVLVAPPSHGQMVDVQRAY